MIMKSVMKRMMVMVVIVAVLVVQMPGEATAAARPMEMALNYTTVLVKLHGKQTLKVSSIAPGGASKAVKYEIANRKIASVTKKGVVKGKKIGVTTIRVTSKKNKSLKKLVKVIVAQFVPTKVKMSAVSVKMKVDQKKSLKATVTPKKVLSSNKKGVWISSDTDIVSVSSKGVMTARQEGQAVVTFTTINGKKAVCTVTVSRDSVVRPVPEPTQPSVTSGGAIAVPASGSAIGADVASGSAFIS